ncbi:MAG TPA: ATP phosphoribosyltransferase, partial [Reyranella sp.]|nr:ATP phosphoribosyltransferase [Reyranella sp.]
ARALLDRVTAAKRAATMREVKTRFAACDTRIVDEAVQRFRAVAPFGAPTSSGMVTLHCPPQTLHGLAVFLREKGALSVSVGPLDYVFTAENPLYEKLEARLG